VLNAEQYFCAQMPFLVFILRLMSFAPLKLLYALSNSVAYILINIVQYRDFVITRNLMKSFPEKPSEEIGRIKREYYRHLSDLVIETVKLQRMSAEELSRRCTYINPEVMLEATENNQNVMILMGHSGNWEWAGLATQLKFKIQLIPVYRRLRNAEFNQFYLNLRSRFGSKPALDKDAMDVLQNQSEQHAIALLADQLPSSRKGIWIDFLNQPTLCYRGPELLANRLKYTVVFAQVRRNGRGQYKIWFEKAQKDKQLMAEFCAFLDKEINDDPVNWLWSHKRWKAKYQKAKSKESVLKETAV